MEENNERYYIGGKQYIPAESDALCSVPGDDLWDIVKSMDKSILYHTKKGAYFLVQVTEGKTAVDVLSEAEAFSFMNQNSPYINRGVYNRIFGEPEKG